MTSIGSAWFGIIWALPRKTLKLTRLSRFCGFIHFLLCFVPFCLIIRLRFDIPVVVVVITILLREKIFLFYRYAGAGETNVVRAHIEGIYVRLSADMNLNNFECTPERILKSIITF